MPSPSAAELVSGFWSDGPAAGPADAYAAAGFAQGANSTGRGASAPTRGWTVRADERVTPGPDGRPTVGYPAPAEAPVWVAADLAGGPVWAAGADFTVAGGYVWFVRDPLAHAPPGVTWVAGAAVRSAALTYSPGTPAPAAGRPRAGSAYAVAAAAAAACDSPCTGPRPETVLDVLGAVVVTDRAAYRLPAADPPAVAAGAVLPPGSPLGGAWRLVRLGARPLPADVDRVALPPDMFPLAGLAGPVTFPNGDYPVKVDTDDASGRTRVRWPLGGDPADVAAVWAAGMEWGAGPGGRTLAQALDLRPNPTTEPSRADLPVTVNPAAWACREVFGGAAYLLLVDPARLGPRAADAATRAAGVQAAAAPSAAVVVWEGGQPSPALVTPRTGCCDGAGGALAAHPPLSVTFPDGPYAGPAETLTWVAGPDFWVTGLGVTPAVTVQCVNGDLVLTVAGTGVAADDVTCSPAFQATYSGPVWGGVAPVVLTLA